jgi:VanZ family protein
MGARARATVRALNALEWWTDRARPARAPRVGTGSIAPSSSVPTVLRVLALGYAAVLLALGAQPSHPERSSVGFLQTVLHLTAEQAAVFRSFVDLAGNVAVFVPLGLLVMAAWRVPLLGLLSGLLVGGACELMQLFEPGRVASVVDVLTNALGGLLGAALVLARARVPRRPAQPDVLEMPTPVLVEQR